MDAVEVPAPYKHNISQVRPHKKSRVYRDTLIRVYCTSIFHADANAVWSILHGGESRPEASEEPYGDKLKLCHSHTQGRQKKACGSTCAYNSLKPDVVAYGQNMEGICMCYRFCCISLRIMSIFLENAFLILSFFLRFITLPQLSHLKSSPNVSSKVARGQSSLPQW